MDIAPLKVVEFHIKLSSTILQTNVVETNHLQHRAKAAAKGMQHS